MALAAIVFGACAHSRTAPRTPILSLDQSTPVVIHVAAEVMADDVTPLSLHHVARRNETERRMVRDGVLDLARVLRTTTGAGVRVETTPPPNPSGTAGPETPKRILIGKYAESALGPVKRTAPYGQAFRVAVREPSIALYGETDLATSYAIYELLDRIGCRWFIPGALGEVLPKAGKIEIALGDRQLAPSTIYRGVWHADDAWKRRNRQGGLQLDAGHALEMVYLTEADRAEHPEWTAMIHGTPAPGRFRWSSDSLAERLGDRIVELHRKNGAPSFSISPNDGYEFDESPSDRALDANDFDPTMGMTSLTDRYLVLANRIATRVASAEPNVLLGFLAYVQYTRPPVRERLHPNLVPMIAPITYSRSHPMSDDRVPGNKELRHLFDTWGRLAHHGSSAYFYGYFLSELVAPNPMLSKWGHDVPFVLGHNATFFQPETLANFETSMHALYMGMRVAFDASMRPEDVYADIDAKFYGAAGDAMHAYWQEVDRAWVDVPEYSGGPFGHVRRFSVERLSRLRSRLEAAKHAAQTYDERRRVELADDSLLLFEEQMRLKRDFIEGRMTTLLAGGVAYRKHLVELGNKWKDAYAFTLASYAPETISATYYDSFTKPVYEHAAKIVEAGDVLATARVFRWRVGALERAGRLDPATVSASLDDSQWRTTDVAVDSWSALGLHDYLGSMSYRQKLRDVHLKAGKRSFVSLTMVDGAARVFINGKEAPYVHEGKEPPTPVNVGLPLRFDVTSQLTTGENVLAIVVTRQAVNELGVGGLMGPVVVWSER